MSPTNCSKFEQAMVSSPYTELARHRRAPQTQSARRSTACSTERSEKTVQKNALILCGLGRRAFGCGTTAGRRAVQQCNSSSQRSTIVSRRRDRRRSWVWTRLNSLLVSRCSVCYMATFGRFFRHASTWFLVCFRGDGAPVDTQKIEVMI